SAVVSISGRPVVVAQIDEDCYVALDQQCTHEGCSIEYRDNNRFVCPCHGALFSFTGEVLGGPAPRPVPVHAAIRDGDVVWVRPEPGLD
ncbi:MAG: cytochrome b6-f complex iron-sulfur subunit, partial [Myxococcota bacterium]